MNSEQTKIGAGSPSLSTPLFCAACSSRKRVQHTMGCRVGIEKEALLTAQTATSRREREAALLCSIRAPLWVLMAVRDAVNAADAVAERQRLESQNAALTSADEGGVS